MSRRYKIEVFSKITIKDKYKQFAKGSTAELRKYNIFYGLNGTGKSTLSKMFAKIESSEDDIISEKAIEITYDETIKIDWSNISDFKKNNNVELRVFNQDFIRKNIHVNKEFPSILTISKDAKDLLTQKEELNKSLEILNTKIKETKEAIEKLKKGSNFDFSIVSKHVVDKIDDKNILTLNSFNKTKAEDYLKKCDSSQELTEEEIISKRIFLKNTKETPPEFPSYVSISLIEIKDNTIKILEEKVDDQIEWEELKNDSILKNWVESGYKSFANKIGSKKCPFCENELSSDFIKKIESYFTNKYTAYKNKIKSSIHSIDEKLNEYEKLSISQTLDLEELREQKTNLISKNDELKIYLKDSLLMMKEALEERGNDVCCDTTERLLEINKINDDLLTQFYIIYNKFKDDYNEKINNISSEKNKIIESLKKHYVLNFKDSYKEYLDKQDKIHKEIIKLEADLEIKKNTEKPKIEEDIIGIEGKISGTEFSIEELNSGLKIYLGHKLIRFEDYDDNGHKSFKLCRYNSNGDKLDDTDVSLSEGETTMVSFLFFIKELSNKELDNKKIIFVIDDPISSMDSNFIFYIVSMINKLAENDSYIQFIFMTHNYLFFRELTRFKDKINKDKSGNFILQRNSNLDLEIQPLPEYLLKHDTEYLYVFKKLLDFSNNNHSKTDDYDLHYNIPNLSRKLIELFTGFKYANDDKIFLELFNSKNIFNEIGLDYYSVIRYCNKFSHSQESYTNPLPEENYKEMPSKILKIIEILDKDHFDSMVTKVSSK